MQSYDNFDGMPRYEYDPRYLPSRARRYEHDAYYSKQLQDGHAEIRMPQSDPRYLSSTAARQYEHGAYAQHPPPYLPSIARRYEHNVYVQQPRGGHRAVHMPRHGIAGGHIDNYMCLSLFACLCCCWPLGIVALAKSCMIGSMIREGDFRRAWSYSKSAKQWSIAAIVTGLVSTIIPLVILIVVVVVIAAGGGTSNINY